MAQNGEQPSQEDRISRICFLLDIATEGLCRAGTAFNEWAKFMHEAAKEGDRPDPTASELLWAWKTMMADWALNRAFGFLDPPPDWVRARAKEENAYRIVEVCPVGVVFEILLQASWDLPEMRELYEKRRWGRPRAFVHLDEPLCMRPGKAGRLECSSTKCTLMTPTFEATGEDLAALLFGVSVTAITFVGPNKATLHVACKSLNQAYMLASRRFERARRSYGGRIYEKLMIHYPKVKQPMLEMVRVSAEMGRHPYVFEEQLGEQLEFPWHREPDDPPA